MKLEKWALGAEILSGVAIVVTLIVLIVEVRGNTDAVQAQTLNSQREAQSERRTRIIENRGDFAELFTRANAGAALTDTEERRVFVYFLDTFAGFEWQLDEVFAGRLPEEQLDLGAWQTVFASDRAREAFETPGCCSKT